MPGGKVDPGESAAEAASREAREEIDLELAPEGLRELFTVRVQAHGEPQGRLVRMAVFEASSPAEPRASAEVSELHWVTTADAARCPPAGRETLLRLEALGLID